MLEVPARRRESVTVSPFRPLRRTLFETISHLVAQAKTKIAIALDSFGAAYGQHGPRAYDPDVPGTHSSWPIYASTVN